MRHILRQLQTILYDALLLIYTESIHYLDLSSLLLIVVTNAATNFLTGYLAKHVRADILVLSSAVITAMASLLMAIIKLEWLY